MFTHLLESLTDRVDCCPWGSMAGRGQFATARGAFTVPSVPVSKPPVSNHTSKSLYTPEERRRRDNSPWTIVQGVLAPVQFAVFLLSLAFVLHFLVTGHGETAATASVVVKTFVLYAIMITGSIWEREIFGRYLFAPAFYWEDVVSMLVLALHTAYLVALQTGSLDTHNLMLLALAAYATYVFNAGQFLLKLRAARLAPVWNEGLGQLS